MYHEGWLNFQQLTWQFSWIPKEAYIWNRFIWHHRLIYFWWRIKILDSRLTFFTAIFSVLTVIHLHHFLRCHHFHYLVWLLHWRLLSFLKHRRQHLLFLFQNLKNWVDVGLVSNQNAVLIFSKNILVEVRSSIFYWNINLTCQSNSMLTKKKSSQNIYFTIGQQNVHLNGIEDRHH